MYTRRITQLTRGKSLQSLVYGVKGFLKQSPEHCSKKPEVAQSEEVSELKGLTCYCLMAVKTASNLPDATYFKELWQELVEVTQQTCQGAASSYD